MRGEALKPPFPRREGGLGFWKLSVLSNTFQTPSNAVHEQNRSSIKNQKRIGLILRKT